MSYSAKAVANAFLHLAAERGESLDPMKLQKLVYYAHGWHLALRNESLIDETVEAWPYGPVIPSIYHEFKEFGAGPICRNAMDVGMAGIITPSIPIADDRTWSLLKRIWQVYGGYTSLRLSDMTHRPDGPWALARTTDGRTRNIPISNETLKSYFISQKV